MKRPVRSSSEISMTFAPEKSNPAGEEPMTPSPRAKGRNAAFTMVEIALCLGVIAFALVAIIGVLQPASALHRTNRKDTIFNKKGCWLWKPIGSACQGLDYWRNFFTT